MLNTIFEIPRNVKSPGKHATIFLHVVILKPEERSADHE